MLVRKGQLPKVPDVVDPLKIVNPRAAGVDAHAKAHFVAVPSELAKPDSAKSDSAKSDSANCDWTNGAWRKGLAGGFVDPFANENATLPTFIRKFGTYTQDLNACAEWLLACGVTTVAVESTGVYHLNLVSVLQSRGIEVIIVDPRQTSHVPGRPKTDVLDCQWIQRLHGYGLLRASFRPEPEILKLREYERLRGTLVASAAKEVHHMQKALEQMNCKLPEVVSDIMGKTGKKIIKDILAGVRDPKKLAKNRDERCKATESEIAKALEGTWNEEHVFALKIGYKLYCMIHQQMDECEKKIEACLRAFADRTEGKQLASKPRKRQRKVNEMSFDVRGMLYRMVGVDVTVLEGIDEMSAFTILSEVGFDLSKFPTSKHFTSWLRLSPNHRGSGGKIRKRSIPPGSGRAAYAFRMAAAGCHHAKHAMGGFYRRIASRSGGAKAVVATARKIAERFYDLLTKGMDYVRKSTAEIEAQQRKRVIDGLTRRAQELGYELVLVNAETPSVA